MGGEPNKGCIIWMTTNGLWETVEKGRMKVTFGKPWWIQWLSSNSLSVDCLNFPTLPFLFFEVKHCWGHFYFLFSAVIQSCCTQIWIYQPCHGGATTEITAYKKGFECGDKQLLAGWALLRHSAQLQPWVKSPSPQETVSSLFSLICGRWDVWMDRCMYVCMDGWMDGQTNCGKHTYGLLTLYSPFLGPALWHGSASIAVVGTACITAVDYPGL